MTTTNTTATTVRIGSIISWDSPNYDGTSETVRTSGWVVYHIDGSSVFFKKSGSFWCRDLSEIKVDRF